VGGGEREIPRRRGPFGAAVPARILEGRAGCGRGGEGRGGGVIRCDDDSRGGEGRRSSARAE